MKRTDSRFIEAQLARLEYQAPPMPKNEDIFTHLVRVPHLWTPQEYDYVQYFHKVYGFDRNSDMLRGELAYDAWFYWHLTAIERYRMTDIERYRLFSRLPTTRPVAWRFESNSTPEVEHTKRPKPRKWQLCMIHGNEVDYELRAMQARGWEYVTMYPTIGVIMKCNAPFPHTLFALLQDDPDTTILFDNPDGFGKLTYYLENRESVNKKYKVRRLERPLDYTFFPPDAGYSYQWEDGKLIEDSYMAKHLEHIYQLREERQRKQIIP